jgi:negative regulator of flagellin synthesis FlgM
MKIASKLPNPMQNAETTKATKATQVNPESALEAKKNKSIAGTEIANSAKIDVSSRAQDILKAKALATPSSDVDEAKVARLQKMIDEGKYKVDAEAIAGRLLDEHSKMS